MNIDSKGCNGDGSAINLERTGNSGTITFSIGSWDCPSGCLYHRYWVFKVEGGKAEFIEAY
ncbi:hypothetical protein [Flammeovirga aprica]|uniref:Uncharacterized protein n=1 Tax=Flammeovirga aprica JL-4 TaxID=694437 RepID=A0A7X9S2H6_9BACT|nr:hypothetical protein [Flammeovirga aprica]NME72982.1 hypothetical protein [Flammeovirga aprica JL-4]